MEFEKLLGLAASHANTRTSSGDDSHDSILNTSHPLHFSHFKLSSSCPFSIHPESKKTFGQSLKQTQALGYASHEPAS
jgi:hypothetical protein